MITKAWKVRTLSWAAALLLLAGCSVGPDYQKPQSPAPAAWQQRPGEAGNWPSLDWWRGFESAPLDAYMEQARTANLDLAAALARVRQADAQVKITGGALLPNVGFGGGAARDRQPLGGRGGRVGQGVNSYNAVFTASYELDFWGKNADALEAARQVAAATRFDQETTALTVQSAVANTYFTILALEERLVVARGNLASAEHILDGIRARAAAGTAGGLDIAQQESVVAEQRAILPPLEQQLRQNRNALAILLGRLPEDLEVKGNLLQQISLPAVTAGLPSRLLERRPDVQSAEAQLRAANANIKQAYAAVLPSVVLTGQGGIESTVLSNLLKPQSILYSLASSVTQPIFEGGVLEGGIELERARYEELADNYQKAVISAFEDVENALIAVDMGAAQEAAQKNAVDTAQNAYDITQAQLYTGTVDILTVLNTQRTLYQAQDLLVQARLAHAQAVVGLFRALGGGWQARA